MADIPDLIQQLTDPATRQQGYDALIAIGADAVEPLIAAFDSTTEFGQHQIALVLKAIGDTRAVPVLIDWARNKPPKGRQSAIIALGSFGADARVPDVLLDIARTDPEPGMRLSAVYAVGTAVSRAAEKEVWIEMLSDPVERVVINAVANFPGKFKGDPTIVEPLIAALNKQGQSETAVGWLILALGQIGDVRAFDSIAAHLNSPEGSRRAHAASALGKLGDLRAIELLTPLKNDRAFAWEEEHGGPKYNVGQVVGKAIADLKKAQSGDKKPFWKFW
jgi:HEAT repeat protein